MGLFNEKLEERYAEKIVKTYYYGKIYGNYYGYLCGNITEQLFLDEYINDYNSKDNNFFRDSISEYWSKDWWCVAKNDMFSDSKYQDLIFVILKDELNKLDEEIINRLNPSEEKRIYCKQILFKEDKLKVNNLTKGKEGMINFEEEYQEDINKVMIYNWLKDDKDISQKENHEDGINERVTIILQDGYHIYQGFKDNQIYKNINNCILWLKDRLLLDDMAKNILKVYYLREFIKKFYKDYCSVDKPLPLLTNLDLIIADSTGKPIYCEIKFMSKKELFKDKEGNWYDSDGQSDSYEKATFYKVKEIQYRVLKLFAVYNMGAEHVILENDSSILNIHICDYLKDKKSKNEDLRWLHSCRHIFYSNEPVEISYSDRPDKLDRSVKWFDDRDYSCIFKYNHAENQYFWDRKM